VSVVLAAQGLGKRYGRKWALRACDLAMPSGRLVALVGPNGAGKTLLQLAVGLLRPTEGTISVFGKSPRGHAMDVLPEVGFVAQEHPLINSFTVTQMLEAGRRLNRRWDRHAAEERLRRFAIPFDRRIRHLSGGQQAQVALTLALAKDPRLLLLDEPVASLDPLARTQFLRELAAAAQNDGIAVVLSSHVLAELERICNYIVIINEGRIQVAMEVTELLQRHRLLPPSFAAGTSSLVVGHTQDGTNVVRVNDMGAPIADGRPASLEDVVLAYLGDPSVTSIPTRSPEMRP
jgi:ABC-2 type transport system ATP-binding protein